MEAEKTTARLLRLDDARQLREQAGALSEMETKAVCAAGDVLDLVGALEESGEELLALLLELFG
jgi:hypothetical protein